MRIMFDAVTVGNLPAGGDLYAGYLDGRYVNYGAVASRHPGVPLVGIAVRTGTFGAHVTVFDTEPGNPDPEAAAQWVADQRARGNAFAGIYTMRSWWGWCVDALRRRGIVPESVPFWIADATGRDHMLAGAVATQWLFAGGYDASNVAPFWPGVDGGTPTPPPPTRTRKRGDMLLRDGPNGYSNSEAILLLTGGQLRHLNGNELGVVSLYLGSDGRPALPVELDNPLRIVQLARIYNVPDWLTQAVTGIDLGAV